MKNQNKHDDDIILHIIVIVSILVTELIQTLSCLISQTSKSSIPGAGNSEWQSTSIKLSVSGKELNPPQSQSIKSSNGLEDQKKEVGGTTKAGLKSPTVSSPRSKQSKRSLTTKRSTRPTTKPTLDSQQQTTTGTSTSTKDSPSFTLVPDLTTSES